MKMKDTYLNFDPVTGEAFGEPVEKSELRRKHKLLAWFFDPWTGLSRTAAEVGDDPCGYRCKPPKTEAELQEDAILEARRAIEDPLLKMCRAGDTASVKLFFEQNEFPVDSLVDNAEKTLCYIAAYSGHVDLMAFLLEKGASPRFITTRDNNSLLLISSYRAKTLRLLMNTDAVLDINRANKEGFTPIVEAAYVGHWLIPRESEDPTGSTQAEIERERVEAIDLLVAMKADINHQRPNGFTALMYAAQKGNLPIVQTLLKHGARTDLRDTGGYSAQDWASTSEIQSCLQEHDRQEKSNLAQ
jgi:ankyrin repeat protein